MRGAATRTYEQAPPKRKAGPELLLGDLGRAWCAAEGGGDGGRWFLKCARNDQLRFRAPRGTVAINASSSAKIGARRRKYTISDAQRVHRPAGKAPDVVAAAH